MSSTNKNKEIENKEDKSSGNTAIVFNKLIEVRRYTKEIHGKEFAKLAQEFAGARGYKIELLDVKPSILCPSCGHKISA